VIVDFIDQHKTEFGVEPVCAVLKDAGVQIARAPITRPRPDHPLRGRSATQPARR
jgi:hypothetical protein